MTSITDIVYLEIDSYYIEENGSKLYFKNGNPHREDGPAVEYPNGVKYWYYHGELIDCQSQEEFERLIKLKVFW